MATRKRITQGNPARKTADTAAAHELALYADNEFALLQQKKSIEKNLENKIRLNTYDSKLAPKLWEYWMTEAAKRYYKEFGSGGKWSDLFNKATRERAAKDFSKDWEAGNLKDLKEKHRDSIAAVKKRRAKKASKKTSKKKTSKKKTSKKNPAVRRNKPPTVKRKKVAKRKVAKRKVAKRKVAKRKVAKRKVAKRKVAKRKVAKRKVAKRKTTAKRKVTRKRPTKRNPALPRMTASQIVKLATG